MAITTSSVAGSPYLWRGVANLRLVAYAGAAIEGAVEVGLLRLAVFVLLGRRAERSPRRVDRLAVRLGFVWEWESLMGYGAERTAWGLAALGWRTT